MVHKVTYSLHTYGQHLTKYYVARYFAASVSHLGQSAVKLPYLNSSFVVFLKSDTHLNCK